MNDTVEIEQRMEQLINGDDVAATSALVSPENDIGQAKEIKTSTSDDATLKGTALLKSLLSASTASTVPLDEKMITTTEVTDEKLNLKKILYQPDKNKKDEKESEALTLNGLQTSSGSEVQNDDDDRRLVIDISDEEKDVSGNSKTNGKSMPALGSVLGDENSCRKVIRPSTLDTFATIRPHTKHLVRAQLHHSE